jgi:acyl-CoA synthetase (AMP-forming)/AMP-acid ligase II
MAPLLNFGEFIGLHAHVTPEKLAAADLDRSMTFRDWNSRARKLANGLLGLGLSKGDRVGVLAYNRIEWLEIYAAVAKAGLVATPINFRLVAPEIQFILETCAARALIVEEALFGPVEEARADLPFGPGAIVQIGGTAPAGCMGYEDLIARGADREPEVAVSPSDPWCLMFTSGTTGKPKGAIRSHGSGALLSLTTEVELGFSRRDSGLLVMPMCHANSLYFMSALTYCGAPVKVYSRPSFDPEHLLRELSAGASSFTSLTPTHFVMMLGLERRILDSMNPDGITKFMISSAPARRDTKQAILDSTISEIPACGSSMARPNRAGRPCCSRRTSSRSSARWAGNASARRRCAFSMPRETTWRRARWARSTRRRPTPLTATGTFPRKPPRRSAASISRSAISPGATKTAITISSIARAT